MTPLALATPDDVLDFWFGAPIRDADDAVTRMRRWFPDGRQLDAEVREQFGPTVEAALRGELDDWAAIPRSRLALVILLDQLTRHVFRGTPRAWSGDRKAQALALEAIETGMDASFDYMQRVFLAMPIAHAEESSLQRLSNEYAARITAGAPAHLARVAAAHVEQAAKYEGIIARFGRFPFRNAALGRATTAEESVFLAGFAALHPPRAFAQTG